MGEDGVGKFLTGEAVGSPEGLFNQVLDDAAGENTFAFSDTIAQFEELPLNFVPSGKVPESSMGCSLERRRSRTNSVSRPRPTELNRVAVWDQAKSVCSLWFIPHQSAPSARRFDQPKRRTG
ncbi:MAG: hypothetical protein ACJASX_002490 [Limisphaerales bacterium]